MEAAPIHGEKLTTWSVLPGGKQISLDFIALDGGRHRIVLPADALSGLMMTLPRMLQSALDEGFPNGSFRVVQTMGNWRLEQPGVAGELILRLGTTDGFEVAFVLNDEHARSLGVALSETARSIDPILVRRPN
jgi:hypothetical protein